MTLPTCCARGDSSKQPAESVAGSGTAKRSAWTSDPKKLKESADKWLSKVTPEKQFASGTSKMSWELYQAQRAVEAWEKCEPLSAECHAAREAYSVAKKCQQLQDMSSLTQRTRNEILKELGDSGAVKAWPPHIQAAVIGQCVNDLLQAPKLDIAGLFELLRLDHPGGAEGGAFDPRTPCLRRCSVVPTEIAKLFLKVFVTQALIPLVQTSRCTDLQAFAEHALKEWANLTSASLEPTCWTALAEVKDCLHTVLALIDPTRPSPKDDLDRVFVAPVGAKLLLKRSLEANKHFQALHGNIMSTVAAATSLAPVIARLKAEVQARPA